MRRPTHFAVQPNWKLLLRDMGFDPADVLRLAGMPADLLTAGDAVVTTTQYFRLWTAMEELSDPMALPLRAGRAISVEAFDPPIFASLCSPNLNVALQRLAGFKALIGPVTLRVDVGAGGTSVAVDYHSDLRAVPASLALTELVFLTHLVRLGSRHRMVPIDVTLPELPQLPAEYAEYFGIAPRRGPDIRLVFSHDDGVRPFLTSNETMWEFFEAGLRKRLSKVEASATMSERVRAVLLENLPAGQHQIDTVASQLGVSRRGLQRQLSEESTHFTAILNATRCQLASYYLKRPAIAQGEIAFLLGFRDINSFNRAFKDWTGVSPGAYRQQA